MTKSKIKPHSQPSPAPLCEERMAGGVERVESEARGAGRSTKNNLQSTIRDLKDLRDYSKP